MNPLSTSPRDWIRIGFFFALGVGLFYALATWATQFAAASVAVAAPFVIGLTLALLLDPLADRLEKRGMSRLAASGLVYLGFIVLLVGIFAIIIPILIHQGSLLYQNAPGYVKSVKGHVDTYLHKHRHIWNYRLPVDYDHLIAQVSAQVSAFVQRQSGQITVFLQGTVTMVLETVVTLIVTFYLLVDIDRIRARLYYLMPERGRGMMRIVALDIGEVFSSYLRGLVLVCSLYGAATIVLLYGLSFVHRDIAGYALLVGVSAGVLYSVPYLGALTIALVTFIIGYATGGVGFAALAVGLTLVLNQIFDNIITPRIVGGGVGLHPVAALFALTVGGQVFGLWGLLLSVPIAASIQVILFLMIPKLTTKTPDEFLEVEGVQLDDDKTAKVREGDHPEPLSEGGPL